MSWPHILSFSRVLAGPIVAALVLSAPGDAYLGATAVFAVAALTDLADGKLARRGRSGRNLGGARTTSESQRESSLGVFLDTTSDKILVAFALIAMSIAGLVAAWIPLLIIGREFLISGLRSYAASCNRVISAHLWGKGKALITMIGIGCVLLAANGRDGGALSGFAGRDTWSTALTASRSLLAFAAALTLLSGARYVFDAWPLLRPVGPMAEVEDLPRVAAGERRP